MSQAASQQGKGPSCEYSKRLGWPLCPFRCLGDKKVSCPCPELNQNSLISYIRIIFYLILPWLSNGVFIPILFMCKWFLKLMHHKTDTHQTFNCFNPFADKCKCHICFVTVEVYLAWHEYLNF